jgi:hypothetical protein
MRSILHAVGVGFSLALLGLMLRGFTSSASDSAERLQDGDTY